MASVSRRMLDAAVANEWDDLVRLNDDLVRHREDIASLPPTGPDLAPAQRDTVVALIEEMQGNDHKIREIVGPMRESLREMLGRKDRTLDLNRTYGAFRQSP